MPPLFLFKRSDFYEFLPMSIFHQLKQQLSQQIENHRPCSGVVRFQASVPFSAENLILLRYLKAQSYYPQAFWQSRDQQRAMVAVGAVRIFESLEQAQQFVDETGFTLVGGVQFEGQSRFILPRLLLEKTAQNLTAYFHFEGEQGVSCEPFFAEWNAEFESLKNECLQRQTALDFSEWTHNIQQAIAEIEQQKLNKVVLANATELTFAKAINGYDLLAESIQANQGCYHFLWAECEQEMFIGSSPERLYARNQQTLQTEALAGTVAVVDDLATTERNGLWLLSDPKNSHENQLVVEDICHHFADCVNEIQIADVEIKRLHNVQHLRRPIEAKLNQGVNDRDCLRRIHPTAAIAGLPRATAKQFIAEHEPFKRQWYAGALGFFNQAQAEFCVTLRSGRICQNHITLYAGAGIVAGSESLSEWQEIERKAQGLSRFLFSSTTNEVKNE